VSFCFKSGTLFSMKGDVEWNWRRLNLNGGLYCWFCLNAAVPERMQDSDICCSAAGLRGRLSGQTFLTGTCRLVSISRYVTDNWIWRSHLPCWDVLEGSLLIEVTFEVVDAFLVEFHVMPSHDGDAHSTTMCVSSTRIMSGEEYI